MIEKRKTHRADHNRAGLVKLSDFTRDLAAFRISIEGAQEFVKKMSKIIEMEDKVKIAGASYSLEEIYWKYFKKYIDKIKHYHDFPG